MSRRVRVGTAALTTGLLLGVVPGVALPEAAHAATATRMTLRASAGTYVAGNRVNLLARLNVAHKNIVFFEAYRGQGTHVIYRGTTDSRGFVAIHGTARYNSTFTVRFSGDNTYGGSAARVSVRVRAVVAIAASGGKKHKGYRLYRQSKKATVAAAVAPSKTGQLVRFRLQVRRKGHYRTIDTATYRLRKGSAVAIKYRGKAGNRYRVRAEYGGDTVSYKNNTHWVYSRFRH